MEGGDSMKVYTVKEAARVTKIGAETLKRACEDGLIKAAKLPSREWRISESALEEALNDGIAFSAPPKRTGKKRPMPEQLRRHMEEKKKAA
jgi:excisionase family DNA binding protein